MKQIIELLDCGHAPSNHSLYATGYGTDTNGKTYCYECCAQRDRESMRETGRATLYLSYESCAVGTEPLGTDCLPKYRRNRVLHTPKVTNWPGSLEFKVRYWSIGSHNMAGTRYDVWFSDSNGDNWHGVQYGENTQIVYCKRIKPFNN